MRTVNPGERVSTARAHPSDASEPAALVHRVQIRCAGPAHLEQLRALAPKLIALRHQYAEVVLEAHLDSPDSCHLVCERIDGETLAEVLGRSVRLPLVEARAICRQIAEALGEAQARGLAHGNLCPDSVVFVRPHGRNGSPQLRVRGFGMGPPLGDGLFGTPRYLAPEQVRLQDPRPAATSLSDQFALAVLFSEILSGQPVFSGSSLESVRPQLIRQDRRHFESPDTNLKEQRRVNRALERALQKAPESRFATPLEFVSALEPRARASSVMGRSMVVPRGSEPELDASNATLRIDRIEPCSPLPVPKPSPAPLLEQPTQPVVMWKPSLQPKPPRTPLLERPTRPVAIRVLRRPLLRRWFSLVPRTVRVLAVVLALAGAPWVMLSHSVPRSPFSLRQDAQRQADDGLTDSSRRVVAAPPHGQRPQNEPKIEVTPLAPIRGTEKRSEPPKRPQAEKKPLRRTSVPSLMPASARCAPRGFSNEVTSLMTACASKLGAGPAHFDLTLFPDGRDRLIYKLNESNPLGADAFLRCLGALRSPSLGGLPSRGSQWICK